LRRTPHPPPAPFDGSRRLWARHKGQGSFVQTFTEINVDEIQTDGMDFNPHLTGSGKEFWGIFVKQFFCATGFIYADSFHFGCPY